jgi:hypothetical protein
MLHVRTVVDWSGFRRRKESRRLEGLKARTSERQPKPPVMEVATEMTTESSHLEFSEPHPVIEATYKGRKITYAVIDPSIAERLSLDEESCRFRQSITENGVIFQLVRRG